MVYLKVDSHVLLTRPPLEISTVFSKKNHYGNPRSTCMYYAPRHLYFWARIKPTEEIENKKQTKKPTLGFIKAFLLLELGLQFFPLFPFCTLGTFRVTKWKFRHKNYLATRCRVTTFILNNVHLQVRNGLMSCIMTCTPKKSFCGFELCLNLILFFDFNFVFISNDFILSHNVHFVLTE